MSGRGTAVGAAVAVGEGDGVGDDDAFCPRASNAKHSNSKLTAHNGARGASVIIVSGKR